MQRFEVHLKKHIICPVDCLSFASRVQHEKVTYLGCPFLRTRQKLLRSVWVFLVAIWLVFHTAKQCETQCVGQISTLLGAN